MLKQNSTSIQLRLNTFQMVSTLLFNKIQWMLKQMLKPFARDVTCDAESTWGRILATCPCHIFLCVRLRFCLCYKSLPEHEGTCCRVMSLRHVGDVISSDGDDRTKTPQNPALGASNPKNPWIKN